MKEMENNSGQAEKLRWPNLLFDFDGTLVSTEELAQKSIIEYFDEKNILNKEHFAKLIVGRTWRAAAEHVHQVAALEGLILDPPPKLVQDWMKKYRARIDEGVELIPGVIEKLYKIREKAQFMGIVTGSDQSEVQAILERQGLKKFFDRVWSSGHYQQSKPHPDPFLTAMKDLGIAKELTLAFEDSAAGVESASQAGLAFIQVLHGPHTIPDSRSYRQMKDWTEFKMEWILEP